MYILFINISFTSIIDYVLHNLLQIYLILHLFFQLTICEIYVLDF